MKSYTLFFSWQSDTKDKSSKVIEEALNVAVKELKERYGVDLKIDHSTLGEVGMSPIEQVILKKIDKCDIFLCDLTPVVDYDKLNGNGVTEKKLVPNSNVLLELGYAMSAVGVNYIIPVAHRGSWSPSNLPFDINHHSLYTFTSSNCRLVESIWEIIEYIKKNGGHRVSEEPYWYHQCKVWFSKIYERWFEEKFDPYKDTCCDSSTVFFKMRMCEAFPGERGLIEYTDRSKIHRALNKLLKKPLEFQKTLSENYSIDPIWWFRSGSSAHIDAYRYLGNGRFLIGWDEVKIRRLIAFVDSGMYYKNYVYLEYDADQPTSVNKDYYTEEKIKELQKQLKNVSEEYAIFKPCPFFSKKITKMEEDDGHTKILGRIVPLKRRTDSRIRNLTPYNVIIAAKQSPFNSRKFDSTSGRIMDGLLSGIINKEELNDYMMAFEKPSY